MGGSSALGSGTSLAFPLGMLAGDAAATFPEPRDHGVIGLARLLEQFKPRPRINALAAAPLSAVSDLELALHDILTRRLFDGEGEQLDNLGRIFRVAREGRGDAAYLLLIQVWLLAYRSGGTTPEIYRMLDRLSMGAAVEYQDLPLDQAGFGLAWTDPVLPNVAASPDDVTPLLVERLLRESRGGGIKVWFFWWPAPEVELFEFSEFDDGLEYDDGFSEFDDEDDTGGLLAGEVVA